MDEPLQSDERGGNPFGKKGGAKNQKINHSGPGEGAGLPIAEGWAGLGCFLRNSARV